MATMQHLEVSQARRQGRIMVVAIRFRTLKGDTNIDFQGK